MTRNHKTFNTKMKKDLCLCQVVSNAEKGHIKPNCSQNQKRVEKFKIPLKETKKTYITWDVNDMDSSKETKKEAKANICLMAKQKDNKICFTFSTLNDILIMAN